MLKRLAKAYLRRRHGITEPWQRIKPPLGWAPWDRVTLRRRIRYVLASRFWRFESAVRDWAYRGEAEWVPVFTGTLALTPEELAQVQAAQAGRARAALIAEIERAKAGRWLVLPDKVEVGGIDHDGTFKPLDQLRYGVDLSDGAGI